MNHQFKVILTGLLCFTASLSFSQHSIEDPKVESVKWEKEVVKYKRVKEGTLVTITYTFTNTAEEPTHIMQVKSDCSCTKATFPTEPIEPDSTATIVVTFDTSNKFGYQERNVSVDLQHNTNYILKFKGYIIGTKATKQEYRKRKKEAD